MRVKPSVDILKYYSFVSRLHSYNQYVRNGRIYRSMRKGIIQNVEKMKLEKNKSDGVLSSYHMKIFQQSEELKFHILAWEGDNL